MESGDQETLDRINKKAKVEDAVRAIALTRQAGLKSSIYLLLGLPWDTAELIDRQVAFAKRLDADFLEIFFVYPFPGTPALRHLRRTGPTARRRNPARGLRRPGHPGLHLGIEELARLRRRAMRRYYLRPRIILRTLAAARSPRELANYLRLGFKMLRDLI